MCLLTCLLSVERELPIWTVSDTLLPSTTLCPAACGRGIGSPRPRGLMGDIGHQLAEQHRARRPRRLEGALAVEQPAHQPRDTHRIPDVELRRYRALFLPEHPAAPRRHPRRGVRAALDPGPDRTSVGAGRS